MPTTQARPCGIDLTARGSRSAGAAGTCQRRSGSARCPSCRVHRCQLVMSAASSPLAGQIRIVIEGTCSRAWCSPDHGGGLGGSFSAAFLTRVRRPHLLPAITNAGEVLVAVGRPMPAELGGSWSDAPMTWGRNPARLRGDRGLMDHAESEPRQSGRAIPVGPHGRQAVRGRAPAAGGPTRTGRRRTTPRPGQRLAPVGRPIATGTGWTAHGGRCASAGRRPAGSAIAAPDRHMGRRPRCST